MIEIQLFKCLLFVTLCCIYGTAQAEETLSFENRIFEGIPAEDGQFPYQAFLSAKKSNGEIGVCGGVLIGVSWVLTTASCVDECEEVTVYLGAVNRNESLVVVTSKTIKIHPDYDSYRKLNNIALIGLPIVVQITDRIRPVKLAKDPKNTFVDTIGIVSGFGPRELTGATLDILHYRTVKIISNEECKIYFGIVVNNDTLCAEQLSDGNRSVCKGDGGGPIVVDVNGEPTVAGLMSWTYILGGCTWIFPIGFTRLSSYVYWIASVSGIA